MYRAASSSPSPLGLRAGVKRLPLTLLPSQVKASPKRRRGDTDEGEDDSDSDDSWFYNCPRTLFPGAFVRPSTGSPGDSLCRDFKKSRLTPPCSSPSAASSPGLASPAATFAPVASSPTAVLPVASSPVASWVTVSSSATCTRQVVSSPTAVLPVASSPVASWVTVSSSAPSPPANRVPESTTPVVSPPVGYWPRDSTTPPASPTAVLPVDSSPVASWPSVSSPDGSRLSGWLPVASTPRVASLAGPPLPDTSSPASSSSSPWPPVTTTPVATPPVGYWPRVSTTPTASPPVGYWPLLAPSPKRKRDGNDEVPGHKFRWLSPVDSDAPLPPKSRQDLGPSKARASRLELIRQRNQRLQNGRREWDEFWLAHGKSEGRALPPRAEDRAPATGLLPPEDLPSEQDAEMDDIEAKDAEMDDVEADDVEMADVKAQDVEMGIDELCGASHSATVDVDADGDTIMSCVSSEDSWSW